VLTLIFNNYRLFKKSNKTLFFISLDVEIHKMKKPFSVLLGFMLLFFVYHFPEFYNDFMLTATFKIGFLLIAWLVARIQHLKGLEGYGLKLSGKSVMNTLSGCCIGVLFFGLAVYISVWMGFENIEKVEGITVIGKNLPMLLLMTAVPSLAEDILTRGYLFGHLQSLKPVYWVLLSALVYVGNHIWRLNEGLDVLCYLFFFGIVLALAVQITQSLWLAFGIHWGANIAFESTHSFIQLHSVLKVNVSNWLLAAVWTFLSIVLFLVLRRKQQLAAQSPINKN
jgi:hypothetical protein